MGVKSQPSRVGWPTLVGWRKKKNRFLEKREQLVPGPDAGSQQQPGEELLAHNTNTQQTHKKCQKSSQERGRANIREDHSSSTGRQTEINGIHGGKREPNYI